MSVCASSSIARSTTSSSLPLPSTNLGSMLIAQLHDGVGHLDARGARELAQLAHALVDLVVIAPRLLLSPTWTRMARPSLATTCGCATLLGELGLERGR